MGRGATGRLLRHPVGKPNEFFGAVRVETFLVQCTDSKGRLVSSLGIRIGRDRVWMLPADVWEKKAEPNEKLKGQILAALDSTDATQKRSGALPTDGVTTGATAVPEPVLDAFPDLPLDATDLGGGY